MDKKIAFPNREEMSDLLPITNDKIGINQSILTILQANANVIMDAGGIASLFFIAATLCIANLDKTNRGSAIKALVNKRICSQIGIIIKDKEISEEARQLFVNASSFSI